MCSSRIRILIAACVAIPTSALAVCAPFFGPEGLLQSEGQTNLVVIDDGEVTLVPNIVIRGDAADFALVVPTPTVPSFRAVDETLWREAFFMTASPRRTRGSASAGCGEDVLVADVASNAGEGGVDVVNRETVGAFEVTVLRADDAESLLDWLENNGYAYSAGHAAILDGFIDEGWVFTAMKLDPNAPENALPVDGWNHAVAPVAFVYEADEFVVALPVSSIHRNPTMPMRFYVVAEDRVELPGFDTSYANRLNAREMQAVASTYPVLAEFLRDGRFLVRLDRIFGPSDAMDAPITLRRAASDDEVVPFGGGFWGAVPWWLLPLGGLVLRRGPSRRRGGDAR